MSEHQDTIAFIKEATAGRTCSPVDHNEVLYETAMWASDTNGAIAEVGVWRGGTARLLAKAFPDRDVHLYDTFSGIPEGQDGAEKTILAGMFTDTSVDEVASFLGDCPNVHIHPGLFPETADGEQDKQFFFVHLDADAYLPTKEGLEFFYPKLGSRGVILIHDYNFELCPGIVEAVEEFASKHPEATIEPHASSTYVEIVKPTSVQQAGA